MNHSNESYQPARMMTNRTGLYLHIPYCRHRCSYCDFFSTVDGPDFGRFEASMKVELTQMATWWRELGLNLSLDTLFFGGGTPSLVPVELRERILGCIEAQFTVPLSAEITLETNPETVTNEFLKNLGRVNRLSLGVQSFHPRFLDLLDRRCPVEAVNQAIEKIREFQFPNWSVDLIFGIPGQLVDDLKADLELAAKASPTHMSAYTLTLKPGHPLYAQLPTADEAADLYEIAVEHLKTLGYARYEISNFAKPGFECRHNLLYWDGGDFIGVGPSASSRYFSGTFHHRKQVSDLTRFFLQESVREIPFERTTVEQTRLEAAFLELRKSVGIDRAAFRSRYGYDPGRSARFDEFVASGFVEASGTNLRLTETGLLLADSIAPELA